VPINVAPRGYSATTPENTLTAEHRAFEVGAEMMELDLRKSSDGQVVVIHDDTVGCTTDSLIDDPVDSLTLSELRALDAGYPDRFGLEFAGEQIPNLEEILEEAKGRGLCFSTRRAFSCPGRRSQRRWRPWRSLSIRSGSWCGTRPRWSKSSSTCPAPGSCGPKESLRFGGRRTLRTFWT
jgi:hypothetical protein